MNSNLSTLNYSTYIGGSQDDGHGNDNTHYSLDAGELVLDESKSYIIGSTRSVNFPTTTAALNKSFNGKSDIFIIMFGKNVKESTDTSTATPGFISEYAILSISIAVIIRRKMRKKEF